MQTDKKQNLQELAAEIVAASAPRIRDLLVANPEIADSVQIEILKGGKRLATLEVAEEKENLSKPGHTYKIPETQ